MSIQQITEEYTQKLNALKAEYQSAMNELGYHPILAGEEHPSYVWAHKENGNVPCWSLIKGEYIDCPFDCNRWD